MCIRDRHRGVLEPGGSDPVAMSALAGPARTGGCAALYGVVDRPDSAAGGAVFPGILLFSRTDPAAGKGRLYGDAAGCRGLDVPDLDLSLIHISEPTRLLSISYA